MTYIICRIPKKEQRIFNILIAFKTERNIIEYLWLCKKLPHTNFDIVKIHVPLFQRKARYLIYCKEHDYSTNINFSVPMFKKVDTENK